MWLTAGIGFAELLFSFVVSFFPPDRLPVGSPWLYTGLVVLGIVVFAGIPLTSHHVRRSGWATVNVAPLVHPVAIPVK